jgi:hypothetical protein
MRREQEVGRAKSKQANGDTVKGIEIKGIEIRR